MKHGLQAEWEGPYVVSRKLSDYCLDVLDGEGDIINLLALYELPTAGCLLNTEAEYTDTCGFPERVDEDELPEVPKDLPDSKDCIRTIIAQHKSTLTNNPGRTNVAEIRIETGDAYPTHQPAY